MNPVCKNHPGKKGTRRCYRCKQYVCSECQILASRHYFCGIECYEAYVGRSAPNAEASKPADRGGWLAGLRVRLPGPNSRMVLVGGAALGLAVVVGVLWYLIHRIDVLEARLTRVNAEASQKAAPARLAVLEPAPGAMVLSNRISIEGEAEDNHIISLVADGRVLDVTLARNGQFAFEDVRTTRGDNHFVVKMIDSEGRVTTLQELNLVYNNPTVRYLARNVRRGDPRQRQIALTFDGDYLANASSEILDMLKAKDVRCTFFVTGRFISRYPEVVRRIVAEGHEVGNHTWSHPHLTTFTENTMHLTHHELSREAFQDELRRTAEAFEVCTGREMAPYWRAPYGEHNLEIREWAAELGYRHIEWTVGRDWASTMDTMDWVADTTSPAYRSADEIVEKILSFGNGSEYGAGGCIILMHLGTMRESDLPHKKIPEIMDGLAEQGYELVKVSELLN